MPCNASYARFIFIFFWKVFHKYYNSICAPICTKFLFLQKVGVTVLWNHKVILEPQNSLKFLSETLGFTQLQSSSDVLHSNIRLLSGDDIFLDG
jgi:hypothetical protein